MDRGVPSLGPRLTNAATGRSRTKTSKAATVCSGREHSRETRKSRYSYKYRLSLPISRRLKPAGSRPQSAILSRASLSLHLPRAPDRLPLHKDVCRTVTVMRRLLAQVTLLSIIVSELHAMLARPEADVIRAQLQHRKIWLDTIGTK